MQLAIRQPIPCGRASRQTGAATLIVVMLLFFVMSLVAAYASRNLIFEQRTSANQYLSTQSFEAAESGIEWALTMLNSGRIDENCLPTADAGQNTFRQRYLVIDSGTGEITRRLHASGVAATNLWAACSLVNDVWRCRCPTGDLNAADLPAGRAAFAVRFFSPNPVPKEGVVRIEVNGCSSYDLLCLRAMDLSLTNNFCRSTACSILALYSGARIKPAAAVTARGSLDGASLSIYNTDVDAGGITAHLGGANNVPLAALTLVSMPGTPPASSLRPNDGSLGGLAVDSDDCVLCTFSSTFGLRPQTYRQQQARLELDCAAGCNVATVNAALDTARSRIVWLRGVAGGLTIDNPGDVIGTAANPVVLVVEGSLNMQAAAGATGGVHGLVYAGSAIVDGGEIRGALVSASTVQGNGVGKVVYDGSALNVLRLTSGTFVRVPGSWRDFP
jgi:hypothetical protein